MFNILIKNFTKLLQVQEGQGPHYGRKIPTVRRWDEREGAQGGN